MQAERTRHGEELEALAKERDLEGRNHLLLIDQLKREQREKDDEIRGLKEKVKKELWGLKLGKVSSTKVNVKTGNELKGLNKLKKQIIKAK